MTRRTSGPAASKAFLSVEETAVLLGESRSTLYRSIHRGDFPLQVITINGRLRIARWGVERLTRGWDATADLSPMDAAPPSDAPICTRCHSSLTCPARRPPMYSAARRSSSSTPSV